MNINETNYEEYLIRKLEGLLSLYELTELDSFMLKHPELVAEWEALQQTVLIADEGIVFSDKVSLKKRERKIIPFYRSVAITTSVAASLLFVIYVTEFRFTKTDNPVTVASNQPATTTLPANNSTQVPTTTTSTPPAQLIAQAAKVNPVHISHHAVQQYAISPVITTTPHTEETQNTLSSSAPVELASLAPLPAGTTPLKMKISLLPYKSLSGSAITNPANIQPARNPEHASWIQFASVIGAELYRLSGRGELAFGKQPLPAMNDVSNSVKGKRLDFLKKFNFHANKKNNRSK